MPTIDSADASAVLSYLNELQDRITAAVERLDSVKFRRDAWKRPEGGGGESRILSDGAVFERGGGSVSHVFGQKLPARRSKRWDCRWCSIRAIPTCPRHIAMSASSSRARRAARKSGGLAAAST